MPMVTPLLWVLCDCLVSSWLWNLLEYLWSLHSSIPHESSMQTRLERPQKINSHKSPSDRHHSVDSTGSKLTSGDDKGVWAGNRICFRNWFPSSCILLETK
ncbi:hypothetical protein K438DRAFT_436866 [Mycena galopus ATCC 62051]|nr:hypothetical protein K438DRAFT_436866 [Mycena galopus ATCC 62051]